MTLTTQKTQDIIFILDESGSMSSMGEEPVQAVNNFIEEQKNVVKDNSTFSLYTFNNYVTKVYDDIPLREMKKFTEYDPDSMTALYDAIGEAITTKKSKDKVDGVICVILTDGLNNASTKYTAKTIKSLINEMETKHNWSFIYLGANQDAFAVGSDIGVTNCCNYVSARGGLSTASKLASQAISGFRVASQSNPDSQLHFNSASTIP